MSCKKKYFNYKNTPVISIFCALLIFLVFLFIIKDIVMKRKDIKTNLNDRQRRFCEEYIIDYSITHAAIRSGYSKNGAGVTGHKLLKLAKVQDYIADLKTKVQQRNQITLDECIGIYADIARADLADMYYDDGTMKPISEIPKTTRMAIAGIDTEELFAGRGKKKTQIGTIKKGKLLDRTTALRDLIKHFGGFEKHNSQLKQDVNVFQDVDLSDLTPEELVVFKKVVEKSNKRKEENS